MGKRGNDIIYSNLTSFFFLLHLDEVENFTSTYDISPFLAYLNLENWVANGVCFVCGGTLAKLRVALQGSQDNQPTKIEKSV